MTHSEFELAALTRRQFLRATATSAVSGLAVTMPFVAGKTMLGANERLGVGFIGAGGRAGNHMQTVHYLKTQMNQPVDMIGVADLYQPRVKKRAEAYQIRAYSHYRELLADPKVDVVCIATPDHHHGYQALEALKAGKDVYCEKPVTHWRQFDLTKRLAQAVRASDRVFQLGTQGMSDSAWHQMRQLVQDGQVGQLIHAECGFFRVGDWGERGMPIDDPNVKPGPDLDWEAFLGDAPKRPFDVSRFFRWRMYEDYAGGPSTDLLSHSLTPVLHILGVNFPSKVAATGGIFRYPDREVPDTFNMLIDYPEKITLVVMGTQGNDYNGPGGRGSTGRIPIIRGWEGSLTIQGKEIVFIPAEGSKKEARRWPIEGEQNDVMFWKHFIESCRTRGRQTLSTMDLAYRVQTVLIMGMQSLHGDKIARFDSTTEQILI